jgi:SpoVK/Ycf46/Vps4 family AAA+-type ATPase
MSRGDLSTGNLQKRGPSRDHAVVMPQIAAARLARRFPPLLRLKTLARRNAHRRAILTLFAGGSDGARTAAAAAIARDLGRDLYRVDLAAVMSKYIAETEKNLKRAFDAAKASGAVLLFDEADALFGKRTSMSDAHDRYAQPAVSYFFRLVKSHPGLVILGVSARPRRVAARTREIDRIIGFRLDTTSAS